MFKIVTNLNIAGIKMATCIQNQLNFTFVYVIVEFGEAL
jgi:hypothetical protein